MSQCSAFSQVECQDFNLIYFRFVKFLVNLIELGIFITTLLLKVSIVSFKCFISASALLLNNDQNWGIFSLNVLIINFEKKLKKLVIVLVAILSFHQRFYLKITLVVHFKSMKLEVLHFGMRKILNGHQLYCAGCSVVPTLFKMRKMQAIKFAPQIR